MSYGPEVSSFVYSDASHRAAVGSFLCAVGSFGMDDLCLAGVLVQFKNFRAYLGADSAPDAFLLIHLDKHERGSPPPRDRF